MELSRRSLFVYALLAGVWVLVVGWQIEEHHRVKEAARTDLRNRSNDIAKTVSAFIRGLRFRGAVLQERLEPVLNELVNAHTNELIKSSELMGIALLNAVGEPIDHLLDAFRREIDEGVAAEDGRAAGVCRSLGFVHQVDHGPRRDARGQRRTGRPLIALPHEVLVEHVGRKRSAGARRAARR